MRILLVDDEVKFAGSMKRILRSEGYAVDVAYDGEDGYMQAGSSEYDVILLDVGLPTMTGVEVCRSLRSDKVDTPILMLTAKDTTSDKIMGLDSGADDYLVKPFEIEELLARIRSLLRRGKSDPAVIMRVNDVVLDPASKAVSRQQQAIDLSAKEFALLEFMMRHPRHILSKQQLLDHVWDGEVDPFSNVVDVYIGYLRAKIDKPFPGQPPLIRTIKGMGYRLGV